MANNYNGSFKYTNTKGKEIEIKCHSTIDYTTVTNIIAAVVDAVIGDGAVEHYRPYMKEIALAQLIIDNYTNYKYKSVDELIVEWIDNGLSDVVYNNISELQTDFIFENVLFMIEHRKSKRGVDAMCEELAKQFGKLASVLKNEMENVEEISDGITPGVSKEELTKLAEDYLNMKEGNEISEDAETLMERK